EGLKVQFERLTDVPLDLLARLSCRDAAPYIRDVGAPVVRRLLQDDGVLHGACLSGYFQPAFVRMWFKVPGATSSLGWPGTVTWSDRSERAPQHQRASARA